MADWKSACRRRRKRFFTGGNGLFGQPLTALPAPIPDDAHSTPRAHPAEEAVNATAIALLGLVGPFDRGSVPEPVTAKCDSTCVASSHARCALRYPQAGATLPRREQPSQGE